MCLSEPNCTELTDVLMLAVAEESELAAAAMDDTSDARTYVPAGSNAVMLARVCCSSCAVLDSCAVCVSTTCE